MGFIIGKFTQTLLELNEAMQAIMTALEKINKRLDGLEERFRETATNGK